MRSKAREEQDRIRTEVGRAVAMVEADLGQTKSMVGKRHVRASKTVTGEVKPGRGMAG